MLNRHRAAAEAIAALGLARPRVLDAGCREQALRSLLPAAEVTGIDRTGRPDVAADVMRLPFADRAFDAVLCVDAINHLPDRLATLREWARLLQPGGRLLFTDPCVITGPIAKAELDVRADLGFYLFVPPGHDERLLPMAGLELLHREDRTAACADIAGRWHAFRAEHAAELEREEGAAWYARRQRFLATAAELARSGRLSRILYVATKGGPA